MYPNKVKMIMAAIAKIMEIIMHIHVCLILQMNFNSRETGRRKSFSCQNQSINIMYPNEVEMIVIPITKTMEIITSI